MRHYKVELHTTPHGRNREWKIVHEDPALGMLKIFLALDPHLEDICNTWDTEMEPDMHSTTHEWFEYDWYIFRFTNSEEIEICAVDAYKPITDRFCIKLPTKPVLEFIPVFGTVLNKKLLDECKEVELTFDGNVIRMYIDGKEFNQQYGKNFDEYRKIVQKNIYGDYEQYLQKRSLESSS